MRYFICCIEKIYFSSYNFKGDNMAQEQLIIKYKESFANIINTPIVQKFNYDFDEKKNVFFLSYQVFGKKYTAKIMPFQKLICLEEDHRYNLDPWIKNSNFWNILAENLYSDLFLKTSPAPVHDFDKSILDSIEGMEKIVQDSYEKEHKKILDKLKSLALENNFVCEQNKEKTVKLFSDNATVKINLNMETITIEILIEEQSICFDAIIDDFYENSLLIEQLRGYLSCYSS